MQPPSRNTHTKDTCSSSSVLLEFPLDAVPTQLLNRLTLPISIDSSCSGISRVWNYVIGYHGGNDSDKSWRICRCPARGEKHTHNNSSSPEHNLLLRWSLSSTAICCMTWKERSKWLVRKNYPDQWSLWQRLSVWMCEWLVVGTALSELSGGNNVARFSLFYWSINLRLSWLTSLFLLGNPGRYVTILFFRTSCLLGILLLKFYSKSHFLRIP